MTYVHLKVRSEFSLGASTLRIETPKRRAPSGMTGQRPQSPSLSDCKGNAALALTDDMNTFGLLRFNKEVNSKGVKPLHGAILTLRGPSISGRVSKEEIVALATNEEGFKQLSNAISQAFIQQDLHGPAVNVQDLRGEGLVLMVGYGSRLYQLVTEGAPEPHIQEEWRKWESTGQMVVFNIERVGRPQESERNQRWVEFSKEMGVPLVATNDVCFSLAADYETAKVRSAIQSGQLAGSHQPAFTKEQWLKPASEMEDLFRDLPEAIANTSRLARVCTFKPKTGTNHLPHYPTAEGVTETEELMRQAREGLRRRFPEGIPPDGGYEQRLEFELGVIDRMGFPGYFLIVADFINWSKANDIPVGPGRGSGAGSLVAYALGITDLDPLPYNLLFERFLNPDRVSMPDFDVDFCMEGRGRVIDYVVQTYGREKVSQIATFGRMAGRAVIKDTVRTLGFPYGLGESMAGLMPGIPAWNAEAAKAGQSELEFAYETIPAFRDLVDGDNQARQVYLQAVQMEGLPRSIGTHAGGVVIAPKRMADFTPLYRDGIKGGLATHADMKDVENLGLIKFDFLGLRTLTVIQGALDSIKKTGTDINILKIPMNDAKAYGLYESGALGAVFQMESSGMQQVAKDLKPNSLEDIIALVALYRPGPMDLIPTFIARKKGLEPIEYLHPDLAPILDATYGVMVYQEQVMQVAQQLAGYSLGQADLLRRAMGKKKPEEMAQQRKVFVEGAGKKGTSAETAGAVFDMMEKFAAYGFNKSHSAAYALISYQTAYLKAHYPHHFMASVINSEIGKFESLAAMILETKRYGLKLRSPDINEADSICTALPDESVMIGLAAIKGVGSALAQSIVAERAKGPFKTVIDFKVRTGVAAATCEALVMAGAFDRIEPQRHVAFSQAKLSMGSSTQSAQAGQSDMFGFSATPTPKVEAPKWTSAERFAKERSVLGTYLSGHPIDDAKTSLLKVTKQTLSDILDKGPSAAVQLAGGHVDLAEVRGSVLIVELSDGESTIKALVRGQVMASALEKAKPGTIIVCKGKLAADRRDGSPIFYPDEVKTLKEILDAHQARLGVPKASPTDQPSPA